MNKRRLHRSLWVAGVTLLVSSILILGLATHGFSGDALMDIANGRYILAHGDVPLRNVMTQAMYGHSWSNTEWLFGVLVAFLYDHFGVQSMVWGLAPVLVALSFFIALLAQRAGRTWGLVLAVVGAFTLIPGMAPRPQVFSYLFFAFGLWAVLRYRKGVIGPAIVFAVGVVPLWANLHESVLLAPVLLASEAFFGRRRGLWWLAAAAFALSFAHPGGFTSSGSMVSSVFNPSVSRTIQEWSPLDLLSATGLYFAPAILVGLFYTVRMAARRGDEVGSLWTLAWLLVAAWSERFAPYLTLTVLAVTAPLISLRMRMIEYRAGWLVKLLLIGVPLALGIVALPVSLATPMAVTEPVAAFRYLREHRATDILPYYALGDALDLYGPRSFIDGRAELWVHTSWWLEYVAVNEGTASPVAFARHWDPTARYILWPTRYPGARDLLRSRQWRLVYVDKAPMGTIGVFEKET